MGHFNLSDAFFEKIRERRMKSAMRDCGMDVSLDIHQAALHIEGIFDDPTLIKHDASHMIANALILTRSEDCGADTEEYYVTEGHAFEVEEILRREKDKDSIIATIDTRIQEYQTPGYRWEFYRERQYLKPEHRPRLDEAIERGLRAREFFTLAVHAVPAAVPEARFAKLPLAAFGLRMVTGPDGMAERFDFYPEETRNAVIAALG
jgi:hypothetical protein